VGPAPVYHYRKMSLLSPSVSSAQCFWSLGHSSDSGRKKVFEVQKQVIITLCKVGTVWRMLVHDFDMCYSVHFRNLNSFIANKCTSLTLLLYVTLRSRQHVSIRVDHHRGIFYMNIFQFFTPYI
jgi:hypothetical protein